jgi:hypothetical protein
MGRTLSAGVSAVRLAGFARVRRISFELFERRVLLNAAGLLLAPPELESVIVTLKEEVPG